MDWKDMLASLKSENADETSEEIKTEEAPLEEKPLQKGKLNIIIDRKGRKGKTATIIEGFTIDDGEVEELASLLKRKIGTGGSARGGEILLQGDWKAKVEEILRNLGYKV